MNTYAKQKMKKSFKSTFRKTTVLLIACTICLFSLVVNKSEAASLRNYQYDASGKLITTTIGDYKISFIYDKNGNLIKRSVTKMN